MCLGPSPPSQLLDRTDAFIRRNPKVSGNYEQMLGRSLESVVNRAEELKAKWKVGAGLAGGRGSRMPVKQTPGRAWVG